MEWEMDSGDNSIEILLNSPNIIFCDIWLGSDVLYVLLLFDFQLTGSSLSPIVKSDLPVYIIVDLDIDKPE